MADAAAFASSEQGRGEGVVEGVWVSVERVLGAFHIGRERGHAEGTRQDEEARALHGCPRVLPLTHFAEQLAGDGVASVGRRFGPFLGRFESWAKNEVCQARPALQL